MPSPDDEAAASRAALAKSLQRMPQAMRERPQWVLWRYEQREGRAGTLKVPYYVSGEPRQGELGGPADLAALATFEAVLARFTSSTRYSGIGFAFVAGDGLVGIDLDWKDSPDGEMAEHHRAILEACNSFTERSPSGKGVHIIVAGQLDSFKHDPVGVEVYCGGRYFTCTGNHVEGTPLEVVPLKPYALAYMRDVVQRSKDAAKAAKAKELAAARPPKPATPAAAPAASQGNDFAAVNDAALRFPAAWVPLALPAARPWRDGFRVSSKALGRDLEEDLQIVPEGIMDFGEEQGMSPIDVLIKWNPATPTAKTALEWLAPLVGVQLRQRPSRPLRLVSPPPDPEYALTDPPEWVNAPPPEGVLPEQAKAARPAKSDGLPLLTLAQLAEKAGQLKWLVKGAVPLESIGVMFGASGAFKSFVAIDLALHVAHGKAWMGRKTKQAPVIIIAAEGGAGLWRRVEAWHREHGIEWQEAPVYVIPMSVDLTTDCSRVIEAATALGVVPGLMVIDTLSQTFSGEENSATEVAAYLRELGLWFREAWLCSVLVIHHSGHNAAERPRGSSALRANVDYMLGVHRDEKEMIATLSCHKQKDGEAFEDATFGLSVFELGRDDDGDAITALVASAVSSEEAKAELVQYEAARGRSGRNALIIDLAEDGMEDTALRKAFYEDCGVADAEARRQAYYRALGWATKHRLLEIVEHQVILSKVVRADKEHNGA